MHHAIHTFLKDREQAMFDLLERLVSINSFTENHDGVNRVADELESVLRDMDFAVTRMPNDSTGDNLVAENALRRTAGGGPLFVGHMDTVFPPSMGFDAYRRENGTIYGPGVIDMKGGLVAGLFAAQAIREAGPDMPMAFFFNADEEIGSPHSKGPITAEAVKSDFCFVMEGSNVNGEVVTGRKGRIVFNLHVTGQPYHAGQCGYPKPSAIVEIAHKITALEALNDPQAKTSVNIGLIQGGTGTNTVAAKAVARVEARYVTRETGDAVWAAIEAICNEQVLANTDCSLEILTHRPPMTTTEGILDLFEHVSEAAGTIGMTVKPVFRGCGSDANTVSQAGIPVLDGLGPVGGGLHTPDEYIQADSMVRQAWLTAVSAIKAYASTTNP